MKVEVADWILDPETGAVSRSGREIRLTPKERRLFAELLANAGQIVLQADLLERLWGGDDTPTPELLRVHIKNLRRALGEPPLLETIRGVGYRLNR